MRTNTGVAALVTGSVDFTTAGGSTMRAAVNGAPIKMVLNANKKAIFGFSRRKIFSAVEDLRGKIIGVGLGESIGRSLCTERDYSPRWCDVASISSKPR